MKALLPVFDETRKTPYYIQLYSYIKEAILTGEMRRGKSSPPSEVLPPQQDCQLQLWNRATISFSLKATLPPGLSQATM